MPFPLNVTCCGRDGTALPHSFPWWALFCSFPVPQFHPLPDPPTLSSFRLSPLSRTGAPLRVRSNPALLPSEFLRPDCHRAPAGQAALPLIPHHPLGKRRPQNTSPPVTSPGHCGAAESQRARHGEKTGCPCWDREAGLEELG